MPLVDVADGPGLFGSREELLADWAGRLGLEQYFPFQDYAEVIDWQLRQVGSSLPEMQKLGVKNFERSTPMYYRGPPSKRNSPS